MREIVEQLKSSSKNAQTLCRLLVRYEKDAEEPLSNIYALERQLARIELANQPFPIREIKERIESWILRQRQHLDSLKEEFRLKFGQDLQSLARAQGWRVKGQYPVLRIGWYTLKIDFQFGEATLFFGPEVEKIKNKVILEAQGIFQCLKEFDVDLKKMKDPPEVYYRAMQHAYERGLKSSEKKFGDRIVITDVLTEFVMLRQSKTFFIDPQKGNFREYPRAKLSYILYLIKQLSMKDVILHLHVATFDATTDRKRSLWIPDNVDGDGTYYSYISFEAQS